MTRPDSLCKCGAASVVTEPAGEDRWAVTLVNATGKTHNGRRDYSCNLCGSLIDHADPAMVVEADATQVEVRHG